MSKPNRRVIGQLVPSRRVELPASFESWMLAQRDYNPRLGLIPAEVSPARLNEIKMQAHRGNLGPLYELYDKMEATDSRYGGLVASTKSTISGMPLKVIAAEGVSAEEQRLAQEYAVLVDEQLAMLDLHNIIKNFADAYIKGAKVYENRFEIQQYPYGKRLAFIKEVRPIGSAALKMDMRQDQDTHGELMIVTQDEPQGKPVSSFPRNKLIVLEDGLGRGHYDAMGAARRCMAWWITKIYAQLWWTEFVEVYGQPIRIARYPEGAGAKSKATMERFLQTLGKAAYGLFPQGMELQLLEANKSGSVTTYLDLIEMANYEIAMALLGQVETTGDQKYGSRAKAQVMNGIRWEILQNIAQIVAKGFRMLVRALIEVNYGADANPRLFPRVVPILVNPMDGKTKAETFEILTRTGFALPIDHVYEQMGVPKPKVGEKVMIGGRVLDYEEGLEEKLKQEQKQHEQAQQSAGAAKGADKDPDKRE